MSFINFAESYKIYEKLQVAKASGEESVNIDDVIKIVESYSMLYGNFTKLNFYLMNVLNYETDDMLEIFKSEELTKAVEEIANHEMEELEKDDQPVNLFPSEEMEIESELSKGIKEVLESKLGSEIKDIKIIEIK